MTDKTKKDRQGTAREFNVVGKRFPQQNTIEKATGKTAYTVDIRFPGMLVGKVIRSPHSHARILRIDSSGAEQLPGVEAVISFKDIPRTQYNGCLADKKMPPEKAKSFIRDQYVLTDKARFAGDAVAAVAAISKSIANKAAEIVEIEYEVLPAVFDPIEAMKPQAPRIHDFAENNIAQHMSYSFERGDVEAGFREADYVIEETFKTSKQKHCQLELDAAIASFDADGRLTVWSQVQAPYPARSTIAEVFDLPEGMVRWISPPVGGGFGGRSNLNNELICIALARKTGKMVKIEYTREEDFTAHHSRQPFIQSGKIGIKKDGTITALQTRLIDNSGAYFEASSGTAGLNMNQFMAMYRCPNVSGEAEIVYTNLPISGGMRGFGNPQSMFVLEQLIDIACEKIGMDPVEFRLKNHKRTGEPSWYAPLPISSCALAECITTGAKKIGWKQKKGARKDGVKRRGIGMAVMSCPSDIWPLYTGHSSAFVKINTDGSVNLTVSPAEIGQGILGTLSQIAAEELGLRFQDIHVVTGDSDITLFNIGTYGSREMYSSGNAVLHAAREAKRRLLERAAKLLAVSVSALEINNGVIITQNNPKKSITVAEVAREAIYNFKEDYMHIYGQYSFGPSAISPSFSAGFAEVEVDIETGETRILKIVMANDSGRIINPMVVEGQLEGGIAQGIGYTLTEDFIINNKTGIVETDNFTTYKIPSTVDMPEIAVVLVEKPDPAGPFGAKSCGENGPVTVAPAVGNAIYNAIGVRILDLPITPEKILKALGIISEGNK